MVIHVKIFISNSIIAADNINIDLRHFQLTSSCGRVIRCVDVSDLKSVEAQKQLLVGDLPDIVVGVPSRVVANIKAGNILLKNSLQILVIDEADLIFSFGYEDDLRMIMKHLPEKGYQVKYRSYTLPQNKKFSWL